MFNQLKRDQHLQSECHCLQQEKEACTCITILPAGSTGKTLADPASVVGAKHRKLPSGIAPPEKKQLSKSVQIPNYSGLQNPSLLKIKFLTDKN